MSTQPTESSLHHPAAWKNVKAFDGVGPFHNLQPDFVGDAQRGDPFDQSPGIPPVRPNEPDAPVRVADQLENHCGAVAVLNIGRMNDYRNHQPERVYQQMPFAAVDLLARIISVEPPFSVVLTDWLSRIAALGSASRPSATRTRVRSVSWIRSHVPFRRHEEK